MNFTFGIITTRGNESSVQSIIDSIHKECIPEYEIIVIGECDITSKHTRVLPFDESVKKAWITKKKNLITAHAKYDNIVYMHDYIKLNEGWYKGQLESGASFDIRMDKIENIDGNRFRDWVIYPDFLPEKIRARVGKPLLLPYSIQHLTKYQYISGAYWIAKRSIMQQFQLDETRCWGQGEDAEWSDRIRHSCNIDINVNSSVRVMKSGKRLSYVIPDDELLRVIKGLA